MEPAKWISAILKPILEMLDWGPDVACRAAGTNTRMVTNDNGTQ